MLRPARSWSSKSIQCYFIQAPGGCEGSKTRFVLWTGRPASEPPRPPPFVRVFWRHLLHRVTTEQATGYDDGFRRICVDLCVTAVRREFHDGAGRVAERKSVLFGAACTPIGAESAPIGPLVGKLAKKTGQNRKWIVDLSSMDCGFEFAKPNLKSPFKKPVEEAGRSIILGKRFDGRKVTGGSAVRGNGGWDGCGAHWVVWERVPRPGIEGRTEVE